MVGGAEQPLLLGIVGREHQCRARVKRGQHARGFQHGAGARPVIVGAGRIGHAVRVIGVAGIVVAGHDIGASARLLAAQGGDHAADQHVARHAVPIGVLGIFVQRHCHAPAGRGGYPAELVRDPVARGEYPAAKGRVIGEGAARSERHEVLVGGAQAVGGDLRQGAHDGGIRGRATWHFGASAWRGKKGQDCREYSRFHYHLQTV